MSVTHIEYRHGHRVLRSGDQVHIRGERGLFRILGFGSENGGPTVSVFGGAPGRVAHSRTFYVDRIGVRPRARA